ncbi:MAG: ATP synthase F1 subunit delta [Deltaproteobacteria bacterium]
MSLYKIVSRYARSLIEISIEKKQLETTIENARYFQEVSKIREFKNLLLNPVIKPDKKLKVFESLFKDQVNDFFYKFMQLVIKKGRESILPEIADEVLDQYKRMKMITDIQLTTATPLDLDFMKRLNDSLIKSAITAEKLDFKTKVDKDIIGGFIIQIEDQLIDSSIRKKLKNIESEIIEKRFIRSI